MNANGAVIVDKPQGWTSHDVVNRVRHLAGTRRIGHLGTLDPNATGVLPLLVGRTTRLAQFFGRSDKLYEGVVAFGYSTDTYDVEGKPSSEPVDVTLDREWVEDALKMFRGRLHQVPPPVSAKKIAGIPAYKLARREQPVELSPVEIEIFSIEILRCEQNEANLRIHCSGGTYVRSIAHDLGQMLGTGAHLKALRRTRSGDFELSAAKTVPELEELARQGRFHEAMEPAADLLPELPCELVDSTTAAFIRQGRDFRVSPFSPNRDAKLVKAVDGSGELIAIGEFRLPYLCHPILVL